MARKYATVPDTYISNKGNVVDSFFYSKEFTNSKVADRPKILKEFLKRPGISESDALQARGFLKKWVEGATVHKLSQAKKHKTSR